MRCGEERTKVEMWRGTDKISSRDEEATEIKREVGAIKEIRNKDET